MHGLGLATIHHHDEIGTSRRPRVDERRSMSRNLDAAACSSSERGIRRLAARADEPRRGGRDPLRKAPRRLLSKHRGGKRTATHVAVADEQGAPHRAQPRQAPAGAGTTGWLKGSLRKVYRSGSSRPQLTNDPPDFRWSRRIARGGRARLWRHRSHQCGKKEAGRRDGPRGPTGRRSVPADC